MTTNLNVDRREFLVTTAAIGAGMALSVLPAGEAAAQAAAVSPVNPRPWLPPAEGGIDFSPWVLIGQDGSVTIRVNQSEMGQGVFTSNAMMICEELECDWTKVRVVYAAANRHFRENNVYKSFTTAGSGSVRGGREVYQQAGASARERLKAAAAQQWGVSVGEVDAKNSVLTHRPTGRTLSFGEVTGKAVAIRLEKEPAIKTPDKFTLIGRNVKMLDAELHTHGQSVFGIDIRLPDMLYAAVKQNPYGSKLKSYNFDAIKSLPGVHSAVRLEGLELSDPPGRKADGVAVVADSWWRAKSALELMPVELEAGPEGNFNTSDYFAQMSRKLDEAGPAIVDDGNFETAFRAAAKTIEGKYEVPYEIHARMEPQNCTAQVTANRAEVWLGTQRPDGNLTNIAKLTGLTPDKVHVNNCFLGGGFGGRGSNGEPEQAIAIAKTLNGRPVKMLWSREEDTRHGNRFHPGGAALFRAGLGGDGMPTALLIRRAQDTYSGATEENLPGMKAKSISNTIRLLHLLPYGIPNYRLEAHHVKTPLATGSWRATGTGYNGFFLESLIDEMAHAAGKDAVAYRRALISAARPDQFEDSTAKADWLRALDTIAEKSGWGKKLPKGSGMGIAMSDRRSLPPRGITITAIVATVTVSPAGQVTLDKFDMLQDQGHTFINPEAVKRQMHSQIPYVVGAALNQEITVRNGRVVEGNFDDYPIMRMAEFPKEVGLHFIKSNRWIAGAGEEFVPGLAAAVTNAIFAATGKRIRSLPVRNHDLSWS